MTPESQEPTEQLRGELEPNILPRQLRALERVAARLSDQRPAPSPDFRSRLDARVRELAKHARAPATTSWRLPGALLLGSGLGVLLLVAFLVAIGAPGGR
jgi:hypothetical protein